MNNKTLASVVKNAREKLGISQRELSRRTGIYNNTLAKIEKGERKKPNVLSLRKLALVLELDSKELIKLAGYSEEEYAMVSSKAIDSIDYDAPMELIDKIGNELKYNLFARKMIIEFLKQKEYMKLEEYKKLVQTEKKKVNEVLKSYLEDYNESIKEIENILKNVEKEKQ